MEPRVGAAVTTGTPGSRLVGITTSREASLDRGQIDPKDCSDTDGTAHVHGAPILTDNPVTGRQAKTCALALFLGRKERLEDLFQTPFLDPLPLIRNRQYDVRA